MTKKLEIYKVLKKYENGDLDKYEAMDALGLDTVHDFLQLLASYDCSHTDSCETKSPAAAPPLSGYFTHG